MAPAANVAKRVRRQWRTPACPITAERGADDKPHAEGGAEHGDDEDEFHIVPGDRP